MKFPPMPRNLQRLPRDSRGYPIPYIVMRDRNGRPHFQINDAELVEEVITKKLCALCGRPFTDGMWFIGGARCFLHSLGAFVDPPAHKLCAEWALKVCPFLAAPNYSKRIDTLTMTEERMPDAVVLVKDKNMPDERPELFGFGKTTGYDIVSHGLGVVMQAHRWKRIDWYRHGTKLSFEKAKPYLRKVEI